MAKSYSDITTIGSALGYGTGRNIADTIKHLKSHTKAETLEWIGKKTGFSSEDIKLIQMPMRQALAYMAQSDNETLRNFASNRYDDEAFMLSLSQYEKGNILTPAMKDKFKSPLAFVMTRDRFGETWKDRFISAYKREVEWRVNDPEMKREINRLINKISLFDDPQQIKDLFQYLGEVYEGESGEKIRLSDMRNFLTVIGYKGSTKNEDLRGKFTLVTV